jgi:hypothetical protein
VNCVATEAKLRFSVRGFGYAPFFTEENKSKEAKE